MTNRPAADASTVHLALTAPTLAALVLPRLVADATGRLDDAAMTYDIGWGDLVLLGALAAVFALVCWSVTALGRTRDVTAPIIGLGAVAVLILLSWSLWEAQLIIALPSVVILWAVTVTVYVIALVSSLNRTADRAPATAAS